MDICCHNLINMARRAIFKPKKSWSSTSHPVFMGKLSNDLQFINHSQPTTMKKNGSLIWRIFKISQHRIILP